MTLPILPRPPCLGSRDACLVASSMIWFKLPDRPCFFLCSLLTNWRTWLSGEEEEDIVAGECLRSGADDGERTAGSIDLDESDAVLAN